MRACEYGVSGKQDGESARYQGKRNRMYVLFGVSGGQGRNVGGTAGDLYREHKLLSQNFWGRSFLFCKIEFLPRIGNTFPQGKDDGRIERSVCYVNHESSRPFYFA